MPAAPDVAVAGAALREASDGVAVAAGAAAVRAGVAAIGVASGVATTGAGVDGLLLLLHAAASSRSVARATIDQRITPSSEKLSPQREDA